MTVETEKSVLEKFLEEQKPHIMPELFKLLSTTIKTMLPLEGTCFGLSNPNKVHRQE